MVKQAVIVAAGQGKRLGQAGELIPKGLMSIAGQQLVPRSVELLRKAGMEQVTIGTGHLAHLFAEAFAHQADVVCIPHGRYKETGSMQTLSASAPHIRGDFLLLESDILYEPQALQEVLTAPAPTVVLVSHPTQAGDECYVGTTSNGQLVNISKQRQDIIQLGGELVGINKIAFATYKKMCRFWEDQGKAQPKMNYEDALVGIAPHEPITVHKDDGLRWCEIDTPEHQRRAEALFVGV